LRRRWVDLSLTRHDRPAGRPIEIGGTVEDSATALIERDYPVGSQCIGPERETLASLTERPRMATRQRAIFAIYIGLKRADHSDEWPLMLSFIDRGAPRISTWKGVTS